MFKGKSVKIQHEWELSKLERWNSNIPVTRIPSILERVPSLI